MEALYARKGRQIIDLKNGSIKEYPSINQAKRESRRLQKRTGGVGRGAVRVIQKK